MHMKCCMDHESARLPFEVHFSPHLRSYFSKRTMIVQQRDTTVVQHEVVTETVNETVSTVTLAPVGINVGHNSSALRSKASLMGVFLVLASYVLAL